MGHLHNLRDGSLTGSFCFLVVSVFNLLISPLFPQTELASVGVLAGLIEGPVVIGHHRGASESSKLL